MDRSTLEISLAATCKSILYWRKSNRTGSFNALRNAEMLFTLYIGRLTALGVSDTEILAIPGVREVILSTPNKE